MGNSNVPDAVDGLYDCVKTYGPIVTAKIQVFDGDLTGSYIPDELIGICFDDEQAAVQGAQSPAELGALRRQEQFHIRNIVSVAVGTTDVRTARRRVYTIFGLVEDALRANPTFAGASTYGDIRGYSYSQDQTGEGVVCTIAFLVEVHPYGRRF